MCKGYSTDDSPFIGKPAVDRIRRGGKDALRIGHYLVGARESQEKCRPSHWWAKRYAEHRSVYISLKGRKLIQRVCGEYESFVQA